MDIVKTFSLQTWDEVCDPITQNEALQVLENGRILVFPKLSFQLQPHEQAFLTPDIADPHAKNVSYSPDRHRLWGVQRLNDDEHFHLKLMLDRYSRYAFALVRVLLPSYVKHLKIGRTSFRPHQIRYRKTSYRKDDKRLHVDAFPSAPTQGKRILRVFTNVNPANEDRVWRVGEPLEKVVDQFLPSIHRPIPGTAALLRLMRITKSYRSLYDHYMLYIHDKMKADLKYQALAKQRVVYFQPNTTWIAQTDYVPHATMEGQYALEQTFYLPVHAMQNEANSPLRILENKLQRSLV